MSLQSACKKAADQRRGDVSRVPGGRGVSSIVIEEIMCPKPLQRCGGRAGPVGLAAAGISSTSGGNSYPATGMIADTLPQTTQPL